jgi:hypothetical protein
MRWDTSKGILSFFRVAKHALLNKSQQSGELEVGQNG